MPTLKQDRVSIEAGRTGWISIRVNELDNLLEKHRATEERSSTDARERGFATRRLFEHSAELPIPLTERFPRLTLFAIALALLVSTLMAEIDYLRGSGYFWR